jgi:tRNA (guanine-N7-)-methyltransferase
MIRNLPDLSVPIDFQALFGRTAPVEIEIGVGKGRFMREYALAHPEKNLLGLEKVPKWMKHAHARVEKAGIENVCLIATYVEGFLERYISDFSVDAYHIYFPDPWPKKKHHKHRIFKESFLRQIERTLKPQGELFVATDHKEYYEVILNTLVSFSRNGLSMLPWERSAFVSNFQAKYEKEGRPIYFCKAVKEGFRTTEMAA